MLLFLILLTSPLSLAAIQDNSTGCASGYQMNCCPNSLISGFYAPCDDAIPITTGNWTECNANAYPGGWVCCIANKDAGIWECAPSGFEPDVPPPDQAWVKAYSLKDSDYDVDPFNEQKRKRDEIE